jgi:hypothetical protein
MLDLERPIFHMAALTKEILPPRQRSRKEEKKSRKKRTEKIEKIQRL